MRGDMKQSPDFETPMESQIVGLVASRISKLNREQYCSLLEGIGDLSNLLIKNDLCSSIPELKRKLVSNDVLCKAGEDLKHWAAKGIRVIALGDPLYPPRLAAIFDPPLVLFYRGSINAFKRTEIYLSIVGSRKGDSRGCEISYQMGLELASRGACVVSGLAYGIDAKAHIGALDSSASFPTIAVLGNGLNTIYPSSHEKFANRIIDQGGIIFSQFEPDMKPYPYNFLNRNRVIAGLSDGVIVIQAAARSGSLVTARYALEEGREVMAVPGDINNERYNGSNKLIKQGAYLISSLEDVLEIFPGLSKESSIDAAGREGSGESRLSDLERKIVSMLRSEVSLHYEALSGKIGENQDFAGAVLSLELMGRITRLPGNFVALKADISKKSSG
jgi:DNA processing protein